MAKFGSPSITVTYDDGPGGTGQAVTNHILTMGGVEIEAITEPSHAFGDSWEEHTPTGMKKIPPIPVTGFYDDTATSGPHVVFRDVDDSPSDATRTLVIVFGGTSGTLTVETRLTKYKVTGKVGALTMFEAVIHPSGSAAWS